MTLMPPLGVLYRISDLLAPIVYHVVRYRRKLVRRNLTESFPDKSSKEIRRIERQFYRNFTDNFIESIKLLGISDSEMRRRVVFEGMERVNEYFDQGKTIIAYFAHTANWEWAPSITLWTDKKLDEEVVFAQVYRPLRNKRFDRLFLRLRSRFGSHSFKKATVMRDIIRLRRDGMPSITGFMSDQKPSHGDPGHITTFLNHPTAMISGTEQLARRLGAAVVYMDMVRTSRGHYRVRIIDMTPDASQTQSGELTEKYTSLLQQTIEADPSGWLWSHNRWKFPVTLPSK
ncbi:MAG: lysophospholipid acyltransferase family protein [Candidatus Amulumruptor sp.]